MSAGEDIKKEMYLVHSEIENQGYGILLQDLFKDLKVSIIHKEISSVSILSLCNILLIVEVSV